MQITGKGNELEGKSLRTVNTCARERGQPWVLFISDGSKKMKNIQMYTVKASPLEQPVLLIFIFEVPN